MIYAYGPLDAFRDVLRESLQEGDMEGPPYPHVHMYHAEYDHSERRILRYYDWVRNPLLAIDEQ